MKWLVVVALVATLSLGVFADKSRGGDFGDFFGGRNGGGFFEGDSSEEGTFNYPYLTSAVRPRFPGRCICEINRRSGVSTTCLRNAATATIQLGCPFTNSYRQCTGTACTVAQCTTGQVWDQFKNACSTCAIGMHVSADLQACVCDSGTTYNRLTGVCDKCPTAAIVEADRCYCSATTALDVDNFACKACPAGSNMYFRQCVCAAATPRLYWQASSWSCKACPGTVSTQPAGRKSPFEICTCTGPNQIFDVKAVACFTCPAVSTVVSRSGKGCQCIVYGQVFDKVTSTCACRIGYTLNAAGNACTRNAAVPTTTPRASNP